MADDNKLYKKTGQPGDASQFTIPIPEKRSGTPFEVPPADEKRLNLEAYRLTREPHLGEYEKEFKETYNVIEIAMSGITGYGSKEDAEEINKAFSKFAVSKELDPKDVYLLADKTKIGGWLSKKTIRSKLEEKFKVNGFGSEELEKGIYLSPKELEPTKK